MRKRTDPAPFLSISPPLSRFALSPSKDIRNSAECCRRTEAADIINGQHVLFEITEVSVADTTFRAEGLERRGDAASTGNRC